LANAERPAKAIQDKLDRLDEAFLFERSIDIEKHDRHAEKLREELTLVRIDRHSGQLDELNVERIWRSRVLPRATDCGCRRHSNNVSGSNNCSFPEGIAFDGNGFVRTAVTAPAFSYLRPIEAGNEGLVGQTGIEPLLKKGDPGGGLPASSRQVAFYREEPDVSEATTALHVGYPRVGVRCTSGCGRDAHSPKSERERPEVNSVPNGPD
jgi:hypothetical protein